VALLVTTIALSKVLSDVICGHGKTIGGNYVDKQHLWTRNGVH